MFTHHLAGGPSNLHYGFDPNTARFVLLAGKEVIASTDDGTHFADLLFSLGAPDADLVEPRANRAYLSDLSILDTQPIDVQSVRKACGK